MKEIDVNVPADVPEEQKAEYIKNFLIATKYTGKLMLFAGDQKIEHMNDDFYGSTDIDGKQQIIPLDDANPDHLFKIANQATIGVFASQFGLIARYGNSYPKIPYLVKLNSKTHLVKTSQRDPSSKALWTVDNVIQLKKQSKLNILGVGFTVYAGSEFEDEMMREAAQAAYQAHQHGLLAVFWMYPRGKAVVDEKNAHLIAGAAGAGACLGADFVKVNYPKVKEGKAQEAFKEAITAAGRTGVITSGGSSKAPRAFLQETWDQIHVSGARGNATGRNIHQKSLPDAVRMANALSAITLGNKDVDFAEKVFKGEELFKL